MVRNRPMPRAALLFAIAALYQLASVRAAEPMPRQMSEWQWDGVARVVVVADVHGAYEELSGLLQATGVVDAQLDWSGGDTHLVSLGDLLDRGAESRAVMDLLMRLQQQAAAAGGRVHVVFGNHEHMNLIGDLRYVATGEFLAFAPDETREMRAQARIAFAATNPDMPAEELSAAFDQKYPRGFFAHRAAFRPDGHYGRWLLSLPTIVVINRTAFVHGGLPGATATWPAAELNRRFTSDLERYLDTWRRLVAHGALPDDEPGSAAQPVITNEMIENPSTCVADRAFACEKIEGNGELQQLMEDFIMLSTAGVNGYQTPFWYRGSVYCRDILERPVLDQYLATLGADRVIVGHTPTPDRRVRSIRDGKVVMADTGMLVSYYEGRPAALVLEDGQTLVQYLDAAPRLAPESGPGPVAYGLDAAGLERALASGEVTALDKESVASHWRVTLDYEGKRIDARFFPGGRNGSARQELAAYALDRLLGLELVASTIARRIDASDGALQLVYPNEISEEQRVAANLRFTGWCPIERQLELMYVFDLLTANGGRTLANVLYARDDWTLRVTGHGLAFGKSGKLPASLPDDFLTLAPAVATALRRLDRDTLSAALAEYLDKRRIRALLSRRDALLEKFGG